MILAGKTKVRGESPVAVLVCSSQIQRALAWDRTRASAVTSRPLIA